MQKGGVLQLFIMSAIVATCLLFPVGALVALLCLLLGFSPYTLLTFGGHVDEVRAVVAWWVIALVPAGVYAAWVTHFKEV
jgi:hypothetical protein